MKETQRYYKFSNYLKERFGCRVYKVSVDAGFSCPNKDGKFSRDGCIYCDNRSFSFNTRTDKPRPLKMQIEEGIKIARERFNAEKFIIYFQAHTNTYAPLDTLKERYDIIKKFEEVVGLSIGTRPDCVDEEILNLIGSYSDDYEVWIEYGLQSIHEKTLKFINRNHTYKDFLRACELTKKRNIKICTHLIIGLPDEGREEILETAKEMARLKLDGIKIHPLYIVKRTRLEDFFNKGLYKPLELEQYIDLLSDFLSYLRPQTVIQRVSSDCPKEFLVSPLWILDKRFLLDKIEERFKDQNLFQGKFCNIN